MEVVAPTRRLVAATAGGVGLDEALTDDALVAVCRHVHAGADLVRLSCVSRTLHRLIAHPTDGAPVWRELFRRERGPAAYAAMSALVQLHGADAVRHVFVANRHNLLQAMAGGAGEAAAALPQSSVWCEAFIETGTLPLKLTAFLTFQGKSWHSCARNFLCVRTRVRCVRS
jgi:hypothetical protein